MPSKICWIRTLLPLLGHRSVLDTPNTWRWIVQLCGLTKVCAQDILQDYQRRLSRSCLRSNWKECLDLLLTCRLSYWGRRYSTLQRIEICPQFFQGTITMRDFVLFFHRHLSVSFASFYGLKYSIPSEMRGTPGRYDVPVCPSLKQNGFCSRTRAVGECTKRPGFFGWKSH